MSRRTARSPRALFIYRTGVWPGSCGEIAPPPSPFCLPSSPPSLAAVPSGLGGKAALEEPSFSSHFLLPEKTGSLSRLQAFDHGTQQWACQPVLFPSLARESESQGHTGDFPGFIALYSPQACNTFLVLVFTVSWHLQCGKPELRANSPRASPY